MFVGRCCVPREDCGEKTFENDAGPVRNLCCHADFGWLDFIERLNVMWSGPVYVTDEQIRSIKVPTLIVAADHDPYNQITNFVELFQLLPNGELALIPGCGHVVLDCKGPFTIAAVADFIDKQEK